MIGDSLKELRESKGISQMELGQALKISRQCISSYEHNKSQPDLNTLINIADYFNVTLDFLFKRTNENMNNCLQDKDHKEVIDEIAKLLEMYTLKKK